jgi:hypothetical protein
MTMAIISTGTDVLIFKIFSPIFFLQKIGVFTQMPKNHHNSGFSRKIANFSPKIVRNRHKL